jgi:hypothetical protein
MCRHIESVARCWRVRVLGIHVRSPVSVEDVLEVSNPICAEAADTIARASDACRQYAPGMGSLIEAGLACRKRNTTQRKTAAAPRGADGMLAGVDVLLPVAPSPAGRTEVSRRYVPLRARSSAPAVDRRRADWEGGFPLAKTIRRARGQAVKCGLG